MAEHFYVVSEDGLIKAEQERLLPIANVGRIMKQILPANAKVSKEAKETMQECVSEFISFVTGEASHKCHKEKRKTVNGDDVCSAMATLGFDDYSDALRRYLHRFREAEGERSATNTNTKPNNNKSSSEEDGSPMKMSLSNHHVHDLPSTHFSLACGRIEEGSCSSSRYGFN